MVERAMGPAFHRLDAAVQRFHRLAGRHELHGWVETAAPGSAAARLLAWCLGTPRQSVQGPIRFELHARADGETWTRHFPGKRMRSRFCLHAGVLVEELGAARLHFELNEREGMLAMRLMRLRFLGLRCPSWLMPRVIAQETGKGDRLEFKVSAVVPLVGLVALYHGHLLVPSSASHS